MIWSVAEQIAKLSEANELFYAGTPENVGPVVRGHVMETHIDKRPNPQRPRRLNPGGGGLAKSPA